MKAIQYENKVSRTIEQSLREDFVDLLRGSRKIGYSNKDVVIKDDGVEVKLHGWFKNLDVSGAESYFRSDIRKCLEKCLDDAPLFGHTQMHEDIEATIIIKKGNSVFFSSPDYMTRSFLYAYAVVVLSR